jgi:hypothetical protein
VNKGNGVFLTGQPFVREHQGYHGDVVIPSPFTKIHGEIGHIDSKTPSQNESLAPFIIPPWELLWNNIPPFQYSIIPRTGRKQMCCSNFAKSQ